MDIQSFRRFHIYCDESSQTKHRYTVIGASFCHAGMAPRIAATINHVIAPFGGTSELKWEKVKRKTLPMYQAFATAYFQMVQAGYVHYNALVVDNRTVDHKKYSEGDHDLGFTKFLFTLLYKFARVYRSQCLFYAFLDDRTTKHQPGPMKDMLNARVRRDARRGYDPYRLVTFAKSEKSRLIQATDVITGAIAYETNQHHVVVGAAAHKIAMMHHVAREARVSSLAIPTAYTASTGFDIWHLDFDFKMRSRAPRL